MLRRGPLTVWSVREVEEGRVPRTQHADLQTVVAWSRQFLVAEHPDLGRDGPVCPFTKTSIERNLFLLASLDVGPGTADVVSTIDAFGDWYRELAAAAGAADERFLSLLVLLPHVERDSAARIDALQARLKDRFVQDGLMIGQFHPACEQPGLWNPDFRPLRCPIPLLAIRAMVQYDLPFLMGSVLHLDAYLSRFATGIPPHLRTALAAAVSKPAPQHLRSA